MKLPLFLLSLLPSTAFAAVNGHCASGGGIPSKYGICISKAKCDSYPGGVRTAGLCPYDGNDIQCCYITGCAGGGTGLCQWTNQQCNVWISNKCPGGSNYKCCKLAG